MCIFIVSESNAAILIKKANTMKVNILGTIRVGAKDFSLKSENEFGFNIECFVKGKAVKIYNVQEIVWMNKGQNVMIDPALSKPFDFWAFEDINIRHAKKMEGKEMETFYTT